TSSCADACGCGCACAVTASWAAAPAAWRPMQTATASGRRASALPLFLELRISPSSLVDTTWRFPCLRSALRAGQGAQRFPQRPQPGLEMLPVIQCLAVDRPAHLFGTGGAHGAIVLEEAQARRVERQPAVIQQPAHLGFR